MKRWNLAVCLVSFCLLLILIALISARANEGVEAIPPAVCTDGSVIVREAPDDVAADAEPEPCDADELNLLARLITGEMGGAGHRANSR